MGKACGPFKFTQEPLKEPQGPHGSVPTPVCPRHRRRRRPGPRMEPPGLPPAPRPPPAPASPGENRDGVGGNGGGGGIPPLEHNGSWPFKKPPDPRRGPQPRLRLAGPRFFKGLLSL